MNVARGQRGRGRVNRSRLPGALLYRGTGTVTEHESCLIEVSSTFD
jgi:hypothetical protein